MTASLRDVPLSALQSIYRFIAGWREDLLGRDAAAECLQAAIAAGVKPPRLDVPRYVLVRSAPGSTLWLVGPDGRAKTLRSRLRGLEIARIIIRDAHRGIAHRVEDFCEGKYPTNACRNRLKDAAEFLLNVCEPLSAEISSIAVPNSGEIFYAVDDRKVHVITERVLTVFCDSPTGSA